MLTKTRTIIVTFIAAGSFAAATVAPAVSQAKEIKPGTNRSAECSELNREYKAAVAGLNRAHASGNQQEIEQWRDNVNVTYGIAFEQGCAWAAAKRAKEAERPTGEKPIVEVPSEPPIVKEGPVRPPTLG